LRAIQESMGWVEWPLDFSESSRWPALWRIVPSHLEHAARRGDISWSYRLQTWGDDSRFFRHPDTEHVGSVLLNWLRTLGFASAVPLPSLSARPSSRCAWILRNNLLAGHRGLWLAVLGHHAGSSLEPFSMLTYALRVGTSVRAEARFYGQRHPKPGLLCEEFGYCDTNPDITRWFLRYENRWLGEFEWMRDGWFRASMELASLVGADWFIKQADFLICGGPFWLCAMLRAIRPAPMLLYLAWPAVAMVPAELKPFLLMQLQTFGQSLLPPTVIVVANHVLAAQLALQARLYVPVERPHGLYVNVTYSPVPLPDGRSMVLVTRVGQWARQSGVALLELTLRFIADSPGYPFEIRYLSVTRKNYPDLTRALTYAEFAEYYACVFWPWDVMMLLFSELYTMTMPLFVPEPRWMYTLMHHSLVHTEVNWWHLRAKSVSGALPLPVASDFPLPHLPWISRNGTLAEAAYWYQLTDFVTYPYVTNFGSLPQLLERLQMLDVTVVREGMRRFNMDTLLQSRAFYRQAAVKLLVPQRAQLRSPC